MVLLTVPTNSVWQKYVRGCYSEICDRCQLAWQNNCRLVLVKGTPGVGKSLFLDYALAKLLSDNKTVMLVSGPRNKVFIYKSHVQQPEEFTSEHAQSNNLAAGVDYVLYDPHEDPKATQAFDMTFFCGKNILIAVSPDPENCSKIIKDAKQKSTVYMGPTDIDESKAMRKSCYANTVLGIDLCIVATIREGTKPTFSRFNSLADL